MRNKLIIICCLFPVLFFSCKTKQQVSQKAALIAQEVLLQQGDSIQSISAKVDLKLKDMSLAGEVRAIVDSALLISIQPILGIEVMRVKLTPDSVFLLNRLDKTYYKGAFSEITQRTELDFYALQALLLYRTHDPSAKDFSGFTNFQFEQEFHFSQEKPYFTAYVISKEKALHQSIFSSLDKTSSIFVQYADFSLEDFGFPLSHVIKYSSPDMNLDLGIDFKRLKINQAVRTKLSIPSRYKALSLKQLITPLLQIRP